MSALTFSLWDDAGGGGGLLRRRDDGDVEMSVGLEWGGVVGDEGLVLSVTGVDVDADAMRGKGRPVGIVDGESANPA